jgi:secreted trypsin-like serine protease
LANVRRRLVATTALVSAVGGRESPGSAPASSKSRRSSATPRIVGGTQVEPFAYSFLLRLYLGNTTTSGICGASLIADDWVLTAAHCVSTVTINDTVVDLPAQDIFVGVFKDSIWSSSIDAACTEIIQVGEKVCHSSFNESKIEHGRDICLLRLTRNVSCASAERIRIDDGLLWPVDLPAPLNGQLGIVAGWGAVDASQTTVQASHPREATVSLYQADECGEFFASGPFSFEADLFSRFHGDQQCAGTYGTAGIDSCNGDSGGPLFVTHGDGYHVQVGVVSWGTGNPACGDPQYPGVYARTAGHLAWLQQHVPHATYGAGPIPPMLPPTPISPPSPPSPTPSPPYASMCGCEELVLTTEYAGPNSCIVNGRTFRLLTPPPPGHLVSGGGRPIYYSVDPCTASTVYIHYFEPEARWFVGESYTGSAGWLRSGSGLDAGLTGCPSGGGGWTIWDGSTRQSLNLSWTCRPSSYETMCPCPTLRVSGFEENQYNCDYWNSIWSLVSPDPQIEWMEGRPVFAHDSGSWFMYYSSHYTRWLVHSSYNASAPDVFTHYSAVVPANAFCQEDVPGDWSCGSTPTFACLLPPTPPPSPPTPPPSPPPSPTAAIYTITISAVALGEVSDFTLDVQDAMREKVAAEVGVPIGAVSLTVSAASVLLVFTINVPASIDASTALSSLESQLASPSAASSFLSTGSYAVTITSIPSAPAVVDAVVHHPPPLTPPPSSPPSMAQPLLNGTVVALAVVGGLASAALGFIVWSRRASISLACSSLHKPPPLGVGSSVPSIATTPTAAQQTVVKV